MKKFRVFWNEHNLHVLELEADSSKEAHEKFWDYLVSGKLTNSRPEDGTVDVDDVEEVIEHERCQLHRNLPEMRWCNVLV